MVGQAIKGVEPTRRGAMARQLNALKKRFAKRLKTTPDPDEVRFSHKEISSLHASDHKSVNTIFLCQSLQEIEHLRVELASIMAATT